MTPVDASGDLVQMVRTHDLSLTAGLHIVALTGGQWHGGLAAQGDARPRLLGLREVVSRANSGDSSAAGRYLGGAWSPLLGDDVVTQHGPRLRTGSSSAIHVR